MYLLAVSHIPMEQFSKKMYTSHSPACILALIGGIFMKIHSLHTLRMHNKWYGLDVIGKKIICILLDEQYAFLALYQLLSVIFF